MDAVASVRRLVAPAALREAADRFDPKTDLARIFTGYNMNSPNKLHETDPQPYRVPMVLTAAYAFLTIRFDDTSILDFLRYACAFFMTKQQFYEWRYTPSE